MSTVTVAVALTSFMAAAPAHADIAGGVVTSSGPLTRVATSPDLNCSVDHAGDSSSEFYAGTACGTLVAINGTLYGPATIPAGGSAGPRTAWTPVSQDSSGAGTVANPYRIVTVVTGGGLELTQTDTYVVGDESYATRVAVRNTGPSAASIVLYRAGDCYLQNSDVGYGKSDHAAGSVACTTGTAAGSRVEQWAPVTPGSHYFESGFATVWARIGSQLDFPDTSDDATARDNGAGLSWRSTIAAGETTTFAHLTAFSPTGSTNVSDSDDDALPDSWEDPNGGVDTDGDGVPDLNLSDYGASPDHPDVFVQVNWVETRSCVILNFFCSTTNRKPSLAALSDVQNAYLAHGIRLHIDAGPDSVMNPVTGEKWGLRSQVHGAVSGSSRIAGAHGDDGFNWSTAYDGIRNSVLTPARRRLFHEALYVGTFDAHRTTGLSRAAETNGRVGTFAAADFMLAYDAFSGTPTRRQEAGTFMHELGHNLGLSHGGSTQDQAVNYKPNYPSVMNYWYQLSGVPKSNGLGAGSGFDYALTYSDGALGSLNEAALSEAGGVSTSGSGRPSGVKWFCPNGSPRGPQLPTTSIDWNCNGSIDTGSVSADVNGSGATSAYSDNDDWTSLVFTGGGSLGAAGDPASAPATTSSSDEPTATELAASATDIQAVSLSGPGQTVIQANTSAPVAITITNHRSDSETYDLSTTADGVTLEGIPSSVALAGNETRTLTATLRATSATDAASFEVDASQGSDSSNSGSTVTEVYVVDAPVADQPPVPGPATQLQVTSSASTTPGADVTYVVSATDADGSSVSVPGTATLTIAPDGQCTDLTCTATVVGPHTVTATAGVLQGSTPLTVDPVRATVLAPSSGDGQSSAASRSFAAPLTVLAQDAQGHPVSGVTVTFTAATGLAFAGDATTANAVSDTAGHAVSPALRAGPTPGAYRVTAASEGTTSAVFVETVTSPTASRADVSVSVRGPGRIRPGRTFAVSVVVTNAGPATARHLASAIRVTGAASASIDGRAVRHGVAVLRSGGLGPGRSITYTVTIHTKAKFTGTVGVAARSSSSVRDPNSQNNTKSVAMRVKPHAKHHRPRH